MIGGALLLTSRHLRVRARKRRAAALWEASGSVILMIPAVVLSTGLFILFMPFADVFALGPWLVVLVNALMALPYVLRTLSAPMQLVVRQYDRLADSLGVRGLHRLRLVEWPLLRRPLALAMALSMILSLGDLGAIAMFGSQELTTLPWLHFTSFTHAREQAHADIPKFAFGRVQEEGGRSWMPLALEVHHALMDGADVGDFVGGFEALMRDPPPWLSGAA